MNTSFCRLVCALAMGGCAGLCSAAEPADIEQVRSTTQKLIGLLVEQGVLTREKADALLKEAATPAPSAAGAAGAAASGKSAATVRVPYVPEFVRKEIKDELRAELKAEAAAEGWAGPGSVPEWVRGIKFEGDLRTRAQYERYPEGNAPAVNVMATNSARSITLLNTTEDRFRMLVRARLGMTATLDDHWSAGVRLTTGSLTSPVTSNQTLGVYDDRFTAAFDRANIRYRFDDSLSVVTGRFGNPWFGTDLVWSPDLSFDGVTAQWTPQISNNLRAFVTVAALPVQEVELSKADKWLFGAQIGLDAAKIVGNVSGRVGLAYYRYSKIVGQTSPVGSAINEFTAPQFAQKGNTYYNISSDPNRPLLGLASDYHLVNFTGAIDIPAFSAKHVTLTTDVVKNIGFNRTEVSARVGSDVQPKTLGYMLRVAFGDREIAKAGDWQLFAGYKRVERDAVLDAFDDSDFRLGGTDAKGYIVGGSYGLGRNTAANLRLLSADSINGAPLSADVLQLDLTARF